MKNFLLYFCIIFLTATSSRIKAQENCPAVSDFPFTETFEDSSTTRNCWTQEIVSGTESQDYWFFVKGALNGSITSAHSGELNAQLRQWAYTNQAIVKLITPKLNLESLTTPTLSFYHAQEAWGLSQNELKVYYRLSENSPWILLKHYWSNISSWTKETLTLPEKSDQLQIAFEGIGNFGRTIVLDDVVVGNDGGETDANACAPSTPSNHYENGNGDLKQLYIANDFGLNAYTNLKVQQIKLNLIEKEDITGIDISFYSSGSMGTPDQLLASYSGLVPTSKSDLETADNGYTFQENIIDLPTPLTLKGGPTGQNIWMAVKVKGTDDSSNVFWEATSIMNSANSAMASTNGTDWQYIDGTMDGVFTLIGECSDADPTESYCSPSYWYVMPIVSVKFADLENATDAESTAGYEDFSTLRADVNKGESYSLEIKSTTYPESTQNFTVFIDWNHNGNLNDDGERYEAGTIYNSTGDDGKQLTYTIQIPENAETGETRMRIISEVQEYTDKPCNVFMQGQAEDYTLFVDEALATTETPKHSDTVYPNPVHDILFIQSSQSVEKSELYNIEGKKLKSSNSDQISVENLPAGIYILKIIHTDGTTTSKKVIKK